MFKQPSKEIYLSSSLLIYSLVAMSLCAPHSFVGIASASGKTGFLFEIVRRILFKLFTHIACHVLKLNCMLDLLSAVRNTIAYNMIFQVLGLLTYESMSKCQQVCSKQLFSSSKILYLDFIYINEKVIL